jgi:ABC-type methionine transport system permease subunit
VKTMSVKVLPLLFRVWLIHLIFAALSLPVAWLTIWIQSVAYPYARPFSLILGILLTVGYLAALTRAMKNRQTESGDTFIAGILASLPFLALILAAVLFLARVPHDTIGYSYILLPVTLPFLSWMDQVLSIFPYHILALFVPMAIMTAALLGRTPAKPRGKAA